jgi:hypothetical protein
MNLGRSGLVLALLLTLTMLVPSANATIELKLDDGNGNTLDILDGAGLDSCGAANCVTYNGALGSWNVNVTTGTSKDAATPLVMDLNSLNHHNAGVSSVLAIALSDDGFTPALGALNFHIGGTLSSGGTLNAAAYGGTNNTKFDTSNPIGSAFVFNSNSYSGSTGGSFVGSDPYAVTIMTTVTFGSGDGSVSYDAALDPVPEPASVALLGGILLMTVAGIRRKMRRG